MRRVLLLILASALAAAPPARRTQIRVPVWVHAEADESLPAAKDFRATLDGEPARVLAVQGPSDDLMLLVVLDLVGDLALVDPAREALVSEIEHLPDATWVGVLRAQDGMAVVVDPTRDRASVAEAIRTLAATGKAGLLDTVEVAEGIADSILAKSPVRVAVLYITDGDIRNYREDYINPVINSSDSSDLSRRFPEVLVQEKITKLQAKLSARQTPLFIVHLDYRSDRLNEAYQNGLKRLAETTAGVSAFCRSTADIPASIRSTFERIGSHYSVSLELPKKMRRALQVHLSLAGEESPALSYRTRLSLKQE